MKALALVESPDHVCCRYRIAAFAPALARSGWTLELQGLRRGPLARVEQLRAASRYDAVILQRKLLPTWQLRILRSSARRLLFDYDDAVLHRDSYDRRGLHCRRRSVRFGRTVRAADLAIAGNDFLADCAVIAGAKADRVRVIPTCIDTSLYPEQPAPGGAGMVWVGSSSTLRGIESQRPLFERIGREIPGLSLKIVADRPAVLDPLRVEFVPWSEAGEVAAISSSRVGVSWIPDDLWSRGKCGLKVLQYMAAGLPVVANPVGVHPRMIDDGRSGFLADSAESWVAALKALCEDRELRDRMGRQSRRKVESDYSVAAWSGAFVAAASGSGLPPAPRPRGGASMARKADMR